MTFDFKLGRLAYKPHPKTLRLSKYIKSGALPDPPVLRAWEYKVPADQWGMFGNDRYGDCTCAALAHLLMAWTSQVGTLVVPKDDDVVSLYSSVAGFNPKTGANDNGAAMTDVLSYVQQNGFAGRKILGWAALDISNLNHFEIGLDLFGGVYSGVNLPRSAMEQFSAGKHWEVLANDGGIEGGHAIPFLGYGRLGETCVTWAKLQPCSRAWGAKYIEESYVIISEDWFDATGKTPGQIDKDALWADLKLLAA